MTIDFGNLVTKTLNRIDGPVRTLNSEERDALGRVLVDVFEEVSEKTQLETYCTEGVREIAEERRAHFEREGFTDVQDDIYTNNQLVNAAICYADPPPPPRPLETVRRSALERLVYC